MKAYNLVLLFLQKIVFVLGVHMVTPLLWKLGQNFFRGFSTFFSKLLDSNYIHILHSYFTIHILHGKYLLQQREVVAQTPE